MKLHLGCGNVKAPKGWTNVDSNPEAKAVDVVDDVRTLGHFADASASYIYACHVLEHIPHAEVVPTLMRWRTVLRPGGELRVSVPDIDRIVRIYIAHWTHFQTPGNSPWIGLLYGGQGTPNDYHYTGFNACWMKHLMEQSGLERIAEYPHAPHWLGIDDASLANQPFNEYLSLNVIARRPR